MKNYNFKKQKKEWINIPIDDKGYFSCDELLKLEDQQLQQVILEFEKTRYNKVAMRNYNNLWRKNLGLDTTKNKIVMDYGCGFGMESLQFAKNKNKVILADINKESVELAERVLKVMGFSSYKKVVLTKNYPFFKDVGKIDVFYCNGVLHHIPFPEKVLKRATEVLKPKGEIRLMLYSDKLWEKITGELAPPVDYETEKHPKFMTYVRAVDSVGFYADWYNEEKIESYFGDFLKIEAVEYITPDDSFLTVRLVKK